LGNTAANQNTGDYVTAIGEDAANSNTLSNMFVIGAQNLPSYADATAAAAAITVALGAHAGDYYLYHDQSDDTIKVVIP
jgi:purine-cytosine permease-like protein